MSGEVDIKKKGVMTGLRENCEPLKKKELGEETNVNNLF